MKADFIKEIKIDNLGRLCIFPEKEKSTMVWRTATEVRWDNVGLFLYSPKPREWSYFDWYKHITGVIKNECNCDLKMSKDTLWTDIPQSIKEKILTA